MSDTTDNGDSWNKIWRDVKAAEEAGASIEELKRLATVAVAERLKTFVINGE